MEIKTITIGTRDYEEMIDLRMDVLLDPIGIPRSYINPEKEKEDILIGAFENKKLIGCCVLTKIDNNTIQLRQMAVAKESQGKGTGAAIITFAEELAKQKEFTVLMMHSRDTVTTFYERCGYTISGEHFFEVGIGHYKMAKRLV
jgi:predicted GNAT family N-acyltransferase